MAAICRRAAIHVALEKGGLPDWAATIAPVRGRCLKRRCRSRWGVIRVSIDFRDPAGIDRLATVECASCGRTWRRIKSPAIKARDGRQSVRLTLILPATVRRWRTARGVWHREGDDAAVMVEATLGDADEAARLWRARSERKRETARRARDKREAEDMIAVERSRELLARIHDREAEAALAESEAVAREARM